MAMARWRSLLAEILPSWHGRRLVGRREPDNGDMTALDRFRRRIAMSDQKQGGTTPRPIDKPGE
jgi:hypothetical protein